MAKTTNPIWTGYKGFRGAVLKQIVFRTYGENTYVSKYPDMSNIIPSESQLKEKQKFAEAVKFAREIVNDPVKKRRIKQQKGKVFITPPSKIIWNKGRDSVLLRSSYVPDVG